MGLGAMMGSFERFGSEGYEGPSGGPGRGRSRPRYSTGVEGKKRDACEHGLRRTHYGFQETAHAGWRLC